MSVIRKVTYEVARPNVDPQYGTIASNGRSTTTMAVSAFDDGGGQIKLIGGNEDLAATRCREVGARALKGDL